MLGSASEPGALALRRVAIASDAACLSAIAGVSFAVSQSYLMLARPQLIGSAVLVDLVLTSALCHGLLGIRRGGLPAWTLIPVATAGLAVSRLVVPSIFAQGAPFPLLLVASVEGAALLLMLVRLRAIVLAFRSARSHGEDFFAAVGAGVVALGPHAAPIARWMRMELEVWFYFLVGWRSSPTAREGAVLYTHHREVGWSALAAALVMACLVEGALVHLVLSHAGFELGTWIALAVHLYGVVWVVGDAQALRHRRTSLRPARDGAEPCLELRVGLRARGDFPVSSIAAVRTGNFERAGLAEHRVRVCGPANVEICFRHAVEFEFFSRRVVGVQRLLLQIDAAEHFTRTLAEQLGGPEKPKPGADARG